MERNSPGGQPVGQPVGQEGQEGQERQERQEGQEGQDSTTTSSEPEVLRTNAKIELAREFILKTNTNIFLTGKAGTGKTTFLRNILKSCGKRAAVAAPTGVAALNAGGMTLHSLFQLPFGPLVPGVLISEGRRRLSREKRAIISSIELLVIDEVSMVRCDIIDRIDYVLRSIRKSNLPFAGVQLLLIGDVQQLTPICREEDWVLLRNHYSSPYFFDSLALRSRQFVTIELDEIFRQRDTRFTDILNAVRENCLTPALLDELNKRYIPGFSPALDSEYITLTTHNHSANCINSENLATLAGTSYFYDAQISGDFTESSYPNDTRLELKRGAQVMFIKNDMSHEKRFYNGMIGHVVDLDDTCVTVQPKSGGAQIIIESITWENLEYSIDKDSGEMNQRVRGTFTQIPLKCAWAITIHKSQGLSFDHAIIDAAESFAHGQVYVALSRCRTLEGMVLRRPIALRSIIDEQNVDEFNKYASEHQPTTDDLEAHMKEFFTFVLCDIFDFEPIQRTMWELLRDMAGVVAKSHVNLTNSMVDYLSTFDSEVGSVSRDFQIYLRKYISSCTDYNADAHIRERVKSATAYFAPRLEQAYRLVADVSGIDIDAEATRKKIRTNTNRLNTMLTVLKSDLALCEDGFSMEAYHAIRAKAAALESLRNSEGEGSDRSRGGRSGSGGTKSQAHPSPGDLKHEKLYKRLLSWREQEGLKVHKRPNTILSVTSMMHIQESLPITPKRLSLIRDLGRTKVQLYGTQILDIVKDYCESEGVDPLDLPQNL